ncbi:MlaD family protein [Gordonia polyisoprenivorans]|uniref:MlaD family protein n=1 Tax=Gordonia polyisoprenivorans TaxID=84595 RepID=UPI001AD700E3|nr:MlaD family protein [Gordonia polyisoprenivorans]QTI67963.1 MCE family protein [Gordonia polyisoprenivorans]
MTRRRDEASMRRRQFRLGMIGLGVAVVLAAVCGVIYLDPFGHRDVLVALSTSGGLRSGDEVRIAGVRVGEVSAIALHPDRVEVTMRVDSDVALGDLTSADVRLTTAIGGHYVALLPAGRTALGHNIIPMQRTSVPYTLSDVLADSGAVVSKVNGQTIADTLRKVDAALAGQPDAIRQIIADTEQLTTAVGARSDDLDAAVALSDEYISGLNSGRADLVELLRLIGYVGAKAYQVKAEGVETVRSIGALFAFIAKPVDAFTGTIEPPFRQVLDVLNTLRAQPARIDDLLGTLTAIVDQIGDAMGVTNSSGRVDLSSVVVNAPQVQITPDQVTAGGLCVPSPDRRC